MADILFGAMVPPLHKQFGAKKPRRGSFADHWQRDVDALNRLYLRGVVTDAEVHKIRKRFVRQLEKASAKAEGQK